MSKHPYDWIIHFVLCLIPIWLNLASAFVVIFVIVMMEYEQKSQIWYNDLSWNEYLKKHALGDVVAGLLGMLAGYILKTYTNFDASNYV